MSKHWMARLALLAVLGLAAPAVMADHGKPEGKGNRHARSSDQDEQGWERRDGYEYRVYSDPDDHPPGWGHGKKTGWGNCGLPPGQAKKYGCRSYVHEGRPYYYYRDDAGRTVVRRPIIEVHGSIDIVH